MRAEHWLLGAVLLSVFAGAQSAMYKWVDEKGRVQYSDKPPSDKSGVEMTNRGIIVKKLEAGMTPEQRQAKEEEQARKKQEELKATEQRRQDNALLQSFTSVQEIDMKRDREVQALDTMIVNLRGQERSLSERLAEDRKRVEYYAKRGKPAPQTAQEDIQRNEAQIKLIREEIERRHQEVLATRTKYEALKKRYQELRDQDSPTGVAPSTATAAQTPAKK